MNLKQQREAALKAARELAERVKNEGRSFTDDERAEVDGHLEKATKLAEQIKSADQDQERLQRIGALSESQSSPQPSGDEALTLGEHFVKHVGPRLKDFRGSAGASISAPEWSGPSKAATDTQVVGSVFQNPVLTEFDRFVRRGVRPRLVVADLLSSGTISGNAISYFVEGALEGAFTTVAEAGAKPQLHVVDPTLVTDSLKKLAGFMKFTDEMIEDLDFWVSEINNRGLYELAKFEEAQVLNGNASGSNLDGIMHRTGVQTEAAGSVTAAGDDNADAIFRAMTAISTGSGLDADGLVINPADYQNLRLRRDGNEQYYGGGYFQGQYGNGTMADQPPVWGLRTVVTPAIAAGTVLVGAFQQGATLYRKGGVRVESTNSHASDFTSNLVTTRIEERVALAVRYPAAFNIVTLDDAAPA